ncbi:AI-2E family transporter [Geodermatophilus sp. URMC 63]
MLRRATHLVARAREQIRTAAERDPHAWPERDDDRAILVRDDEPWTTADDGGGAGNGDSGGNGGDSGGDDDAPLGSPAPDAPDLDGPLGPGGVSGPPEGGRPHRPAERGRRLLGPGRDVPHGDAAVPSGLRTAASWSWRMIAVLAGLYVLLYVAAYVAVVLVPVMVALLLAALLQPGAAALIRHGWPRSLAALVMLLVGLGVVAGIITLVVQQVTAGFTDLADQVTQGLDQIRDFVVETFPVSQRQIDEALTSFQDFVAGNQEELASGAITTAATVGEVFTGVALALFTLFFFLKDGRSIWLWLVGLFPRDSRAYLDEAARRSWRTLISYVRATVAVALVDAVGIGIGLAVLGVPLVVPLAALVFLGAFIPIIGSFLAGSVAVLVALVAVGPIKALIALAIVVLVMQLEGHVLQPLLLGKAVHVHPLAVVLAIAAGLLVAGIFGALIAVPVVACANVAGTYLSRRHDGPRPPEPRPERARPAVGVRT